MFANFTIHVYGNDRVQKDIYSGFVDLYRNINKSET